jgi:hypothetical protein
MKTLYSLFGISYRSRLIGGNHTQILKPIGRRCLSEAIKIDTNSRSVMVDKCNRSRKGRRRKEKEDEGEGEERERGERGERGERERGGHPAAGDVPASPNGLKKKKEFELFHDVTRTFAVPTLSQKINHKIHTFFEQRKEGLLRCDFPEGTAEVCV